ncbi:hypothetical protein V8J88_06000 [Massilia sp. W12]|uniref:hypothetical protein n=1 Tax=Massilia sp. W12 TaxID=3126507 RepID=UPI0030D2F616
MFGKQDKNEKLKERKAKKSSAYQSAPALDAGKCDMRLRTGWDARHLRILRAERIGAQLIFAAHHNANFADGAGFCGTVFITHCIKPGCVMVRLAGWGLKA